MRAQQNWDGLSRINHWVLAVMMIGMLVFGVYLHEFMPRGPEKAALIGVHKAVGVLIFFLALWRVGYRLVRGFLPDAAPMARWQSVSAKLAHWGLLASVVLMPLTGMLGSYFGARPVDVFGMFTMPAVEIANADPAGMFMGLHGGFAKLTIFLLLLHLAGALKHHLVDRDATLKRMLGRA
ncbi:cytochrome b [Shimia biformata]|uniref:cytochrome b n=1 Tax=Shimia biformata TaxID=1294299 RepID=UPI00194FC099|nr:cytochrome b [Shimia biformata]